MFQFVTASLCYPVPEATPFAIPRLIATVRLHTNKRFSSCFVREIGKKSPWSLLHSAQTYASLELQIAERAAQPARSIHLIQREPQQSFTLLAFEVDYWLRIGEVAPNKFQYPRSRELHSCKVAPWLPLTPHIADSTTYPISSTHKHYKPRFC